MARPKAFDPEDALTVAMGLFWKKGYDATSVADLTKAMGINKFSLYDTFGDKRSLFLKALAHYRQTSVARQFACLKVEEGLFGLTLFFEQIVQMPNEAKTGGCLMMNSLVELSGRDPEIDKIVREHFKWIEAQLSNALLQAQSAGDLAPNIDPKEKAQTLMALLQGVIALGKAPFGRRIAKNAVQDALTSLAA